MEKPQHQLTVAIPLLRILRNQRNELPAWPILNIGSDNDTFGLCRSAGTSACSGTTRVIS